MRLIGALKDCKQRSLTVSKKAPTVNKKASPKILPPWDQEFYPVLGLGSGGRLLRHFQTPTLHWICFSLVRGLLGTDPPGPHPRIRLTFPSSGVNLASIRHRFPDLTLDPIFSMPNRPLRRGGEANSRVRSGGLCLIDKPLTRLKYEERFD